MPRSVSAAHKFCTTFQRTSSHLSGGHGLHKMSAHPIGTELHAVILNACSEFENIPVISAGKDSLLLGFPHCTKTVWFVRVTQQYPISGIPPSFTK